MPDSNQTSSQLRTHLGCITFLAVAFLVMFWRVFFLGETLIDARTLNNQLPWGYSAGSSEYPYNRRDLTDTYVTREYFIVQAYKDGELPLWNPYTMAGHPIYADGVTRIFSPFLLFYTFLDVPLGYSVARITELFLASAFMYMFLIYLGLDSRAGLIGSLVFAFSAHSMFHLSGLGWWGGLMWLPLIILFADRALTRGGYRDAAISGVFLALQLFCGYMPNEIYYFGAVMFYYIAAPLLRKKSEDSPTGSVRGLKLAVVTISVGLLLGASQWVPVVELLQHSNRRIVPTEMGYIYLPPWYLATLVLPNLFGSAYDVKFVELFTALSVSHDHILYLGIAALLPLGFLAYSLRGGWRAAHWRIRLFGLLFVASLVIMMAAPVYVHVTRFIPVLQTIRVIVRAGVLFVFAASALAAFGSAALIKADSKALSEFLRYAKRFVIAVFVVVTIAIAASYAVRLSGIQVDRTGRGARAFALKTVDVMAGQFTPPGADIIMPLSFLIAAVALLALMAHSRMRIGASIFTLIALLVVDLFWNAGPFNPTFDRSSVFPRTEITDLLSSLEPGRVLVTPADLESNRRADWDTTGRKVIAPPNTFLPYGIPTVTGKDQLFPKTYRSYCELIEPQPNLSHVVFETSVSPLFDALNVKYVVTHESSDAPEGHKLLATAEGLSIYENPNVVPRAYLAGDSAYAEGDKAGLAESGALGSARIIGDRRNRVVISTETRSDALLVLSDNHYPGWHAYIDGQPARIDRANHTMRVVKVPAGRHMVSFEFLPVSFWTSLYVSVGTAVLLSAWFVVGRFRRRRG